MATTAAVDFMSARAMFRDILSEYDDLELSGAFMLNLVAVRHLISEGRLENNASSLVIFTINKSNLDTPLESLSCFHYRTSDAGSVDPSSTSHPFIRVRVEVADASGQKQLQLQQQQQQKQKHALVHLDDCAFWGRLLPMAGFLTSMASSTASVREVTAVGNIVLLANDAPPLYCGERVLCSHAQCFVCGASTTRLCSACKRATYCGAACQNAGWPTHRAVCCAYSSPRDLVERFNAYCRIVSILDAYAYSSHATQSRALVEAFNVSCRIL